MRDLFFLIIIYPLYLIIEVSYQLSLTIFKSSGISIICVSVIITLLCLPLYAIAEHWQQIERKKQDEMKNMLSVIKTAFKKDERYMMTNAYYREVHYNPIMAMRSSLGLLIQIPFFVAAYRFLSSNSDLIGKSFLFIKDLGEPDKLFSIGNFPINILPIAMTLINIIAGSIYTRGFPLREKLQIYGMALIFLVILYGSPAGLVLYWTCNNIFSLAKNIFYKLKNPLKTFWIFSCILCLSVCLFLILRGSRFKHIAFFGIITLFVFALPLLIRFCNFLLNTILQPLVKNNKRHFIFILSCVSLCFLIGLVIPTNLISSSPTEFSLSEVPNPLSFVFNTFLQSVGFFVFWPLCIYFLFNKKVQTILTSVVLALLCCAIVNTFLFALNYGDISVSLTFSNATLLETSKKIIFINFISLIASAVLGFIILSFKEKWMRNALTVFTTVALFVSIFNITHIKKTYSDYISNKVAQKNISPIFNFSKTQKNVLLIMLDKAEPIFFDEILNEWPEVKNIFQGFTYYPNCVSFNGHTLIGSPPLYGGYEYTPLEINNRKDVPLVNKHNESLLLLPRIFTEVLDYDASITDPSWSNHKWHPDLSPFTPFPKIKAHTTIHSYTSYWNKQNPDIKVPDTTAKRLKRNLIFFAFFKISPPVFRKFIYQNGNYRGNISSSHWETVIGNYSPLDLLPELTTCNATKGLYACFVNELTHTSAFFQAPDYTPVGDVTNYGTSKYFDNDVYHCNIAAFKRLSEFFDFLKKHDCYDNTRIIIVSDHGGDYNIRSKKFEKENNLDKKVTAGFYVGRGYYNPLLLVKDFHKMNSLEEDNRFMTNADVPSLLLKDIVENPVNPFTKKALLLDTTELKQNGVIITTNDDFAADDHSKNTFNIKDNEWWQVKDNVFKEENWKQIPSPIKN